MKNKVSKRIVNEQILKEYKVSSTIKLMEFLLNTFKDKSRNNIKSLLKRKLILVNGAPISQFDFELVKGDIVQISPVSVNKTKQMASKLKILYEDDELLVIDKPAGLLSVASDKEKTITAYRLCSDYMHAKDSHSRIFVTHRIDKETSGVLLFCKNENLRNILQDKWNDLVKTRQYVALVQGTFDKKEGEIISWLRESDTNMMYSSRKKGDGQKAITKYKVINDNFKYSLLDVHIETGRKNQIRVHMQDIKHPIVGDDKYGSDFDPIKRLGLHAKKLVIVHPLNGKTLSFVASTPKEFTKVFANDFVEPSPRKEVIKQRKKNLKS